MRNRRFHGESSIHLHNKPTLRETSIWRNTVHTVTRVCGQNGDTMRCPHSHIRRIWHRALFPSSYAAIRHSPSVPCLPGRLSSTITHRRHARLLSSLLLVADWITGEESCTMDYTRRTGHLVDRSTSGRGEERVSTRYFGHVNSC